MCLALIFARGLNIWNNIHTLNIPVGDIERLGRLSLFSEIDNLHRESNILHFDLPQPWSVWLRFLQEIRIDQYTYWMRYNINWKTATWYFACIKLTSSRAVSYTRLHRIKNNQAISIDWKTGYGGLELEQGGNDHDLMMAMVVMVVMMAMMWGWRYCRWWWLWQWWCWWWWPVT